jgi:hypothetical protein
MRMPTGASPPLRYASTYGSSTYTSTQPTLWPADAKRAALTFTQLGQVEQSDAAAPAPSPVTSPASTAA